MLNNTSKREGFPLLLNETGSTYIVPPLSYVAIADGFFETKDSLIVSPYLQGSNHDSLTYDSLLGNRPDDEVTTAILEMYLWESNAYRGSIRDEVTEGGYDDPIDILEYPYWRGPERKKATIFGMGVHCDIRTEVGSAYLDPGQRTFSSFMRNSSALTSGTSMGDLPGYSMFPPQTLALAALSSPLTFSSDGIIDGALIPQDNIQPWVDLHHAINSPPAPPPITADIVEYTGFSESYYKALRPKDLQLAIYKLLGESVIAMMDEGGPGPWTGELRTLKYTKYIVTGIFPWPYVLSFLSVWTLIICAGALWSMIARPRWATTLGGFEMFRFGAQYTDELEDLADLDFRGCHAALTRIPGMVGMLPGSTGPKEPPAKLGFVGLSESATSPHLEYASQERSCLDETSIIRLEIQVGVC